MVRRYIAAAVSVVLVMVSSGLPAMADSIAMPEIHEFTLSTGQKLYIKEDHDQPVCTHEHVVCIRVRKDLQTGFLKFHSDGNRKGSSENSCDD